MQVNIYVGKMCCLLFAKQILYININYSFYLPNNSWWNKQRQRKKQSKENSFICSYYQAYAFPGKLQYRLVEVLFSNRKQSGILPIIRHLRKQRAQKKNILKENAREYFKEVESKQKFFLFWDILNPSSSSHPAPKIITQPKISIVPSLRNREIEYYTWI